MKAPMIADPTPMIAEEERKNLDEISRRVIGAAQRVHNTLGYGFLEKVYENALVVELRAQGLGVLQQRPIQVWYAGQVIGDYVPDLLVEERVIIEVKAVTGLDRVHSQQCINYLKSTGHRVCLLINFGRARLELKRLVWKF